MNIEKIKENQELERKINALAQDLPKASDYIPTRTVETVDFTLLHEQVKEQAEQTIRNIASVFFDLSNVPDNVKRMVESRIEIDVLTIQSIIYQIRTSEYAVGQLLNELSTGITSNSVRLFEALNGLQKTNVDSTKTLNSILMLLEKQYSELFESVESLMIKRGDTEKDGISRGSRDMLKELSDLDAEVELLNSSLEIDKHE